MKCMGRGGVRLCPIFLWVIHVPSEGTWLVNKHTIEISNVLVLVRFTDTIIKRYVFKS